MCRLCWQELFGRGLRAQKRGVRKDKNVLSAAIVDAGFAPDVRAAQLKTGLDTETCRRAVVVSANELASRCAQQRRDSLSEVAPCKLQVFASMQLSFSILSTAIQL